MPVRLFAPACVCPRISRRNGKDGCTRKSRRASASSGRIRLRACLLRQFFRGLRRVIARSRRKPGRQWSTGSSSIPRRKPNSNSPMTTWPTAIAGDRPEFHCRHLRPYSLGLSTFPQRGAEWVRPCLACADHRLSARCEHPCGRGRSGLDPGHVFQWPEHHRGTAGRPALKHCLGWRRLSIFPGRGGDFQAYGTCPPPRGGAPRQV